MSQFRYQPDKVAVGTVYFYEKSNIDGSHPSDIALYIATQDSLNSFKWLKGESEATIVTTKRDWGNFSARELQSWRLMQTGERILGGSMRQVEGQNQMIASANFDWLKFEQAVTIESYPWDSYDADFAGLNISLPHLIDPVAPFTFGVIDVDYKANTPTVVFKGVVTIEYLADEDRYGSLCRKYKIDGPGLEDRGGMMWVDKAAQHIVDYEIDLPDEPGYESGKLRLKQIDHMSAEAWRKFMAAQLA